MRYPFAVNHYIWPAGWPLGDFLDLAARLGAGSVALTRRALSEMAPDRLRRELYRRDLSVSSLNSAGYFTDPDAAFQARQAEENRRLVQAAATLEAGALCVITGGAGAFDRLPDARARFVDKLGALDGEAEAVGVTLGLEPIHPAECLTKGVCNSIHQALDVIRDLSATRLIVDLYHSAHDPELGALLGGQPAHPVVLQVCEPVMRAGAMHRDLPLSDWAARCVATARDSGFQGAIEVELFERDLFGRDPARLLSSVFPSVWAAQY
ncbi:sugar phosphate isomerase/epimerase [Lutimaribacter sp. EGI FJ00015]|uniref:Sugar phosphate isomerase/epimerase n=1 Tax=Lutimaribacter degradans TaxID=2945989 RepID=A0ACC6A044_9RHOB|nr:sugar phosphate isomerase/epimerase family protein [Lutimaribacter sp. EGI FJ00013]MCM2562979.1 sugar phosphate isomerase/epimerase [Lutimaribacter sp. EGI FJ00013]MCO0614147.1 sugar phosphate isomerase/epimerase [Lutimaribacter sp. EGI FJ00015]MCO0636124.1 sugar phosphate isomerase/epimerase [Lutimaribacter sp. EGI FJ00014]